MKKINCVIADDEPLARDVIKSHVSMLERINVVAYCTNGLEVYTTIKSTAVDLIFLDIEMPHLTGIELLRTIKNPPAVIITTAYPQFALEGYELDVIDYLLKPISFERLLKAIDKYETRINPGHQGSLPLQKQEATYNDAFFYIKSDKKMIRVVLADINYIEGLKDYVKIHLAGSQLITYQTMAYFEEKLPSKQFMRVHRSFIVSINHISSYSATGLAIGNKVVPIGSTYQKEVSKKLNLITRG